MGSGSCRDQPQGGSSIASKLAVVALSLMAVVGARSTWRAQGAVTKAGLLRQACVPEGGLWACSGR